MYGFEPLDVRLEYTFWYDPGNGEEDITHFDNLSDAEQFKQTKRISKFERYIGNLE